MADYQKLYHFLFNQISNAIELLQEAQRAAEQVYMDSPDAPMALLPGERASKEAGARRQEKRGSENGPRGNGKAQTKNEK